MLSAATTRRWCPTTDAGGTAGRQLRNRATAVAATRRSPANPRAPGRGGSRGDRTGLPTAIRGPEAIANARRPTALRARARRLQARGTPLQRGAERRALRHARGSAPSRRAQPSRAHRTRSGPRRLPPRVRAGTARVAAPGPRAPSRRGRPPAGGPPVCGPASKDPRPPAPTVRAGGRTRARTPRLRGVGRSAAATSAPRRRTRRSRAPIQDAFRSSSYFDHHRQDHWPPARAVVHELPDAVVDVLLKELDLANVLCEQVADDALRFRPHLGEQLVRLREAASDELGRSDGAVRHRRDDDQNAVFREVPPVTERDVGHVADAQAVDERDAAVDAVDDPDAVAGKLDDVAVLGDDDRGRRDADVLGEAGMRREHPELAVDRHHRLRPREREERPQLLGARVTRNVNRGVLLVEHLRTVARQAVDRVVHPEFVPWDGSRRDDDGVAALDADRGMVVVGDARERGQRLALRPRAEDQLLLGRDVVQLDGAND